MMLYVSKWSQKRPQVYAGVIDKMYQGFHGPFKWEQKSDGVIIYDVIFSKTIRFAIVVVIDKGKFLHNFISNVQYNLFNFTEFWCCKWWCRT